MWGLSLSADRQGALPHAADQPSDILYQPFHQTIFSLLTRALTGVVFGQLVPPEWKHNYRLIKSKYKKTVFNSRHKK